MRHTQIVDEQTKEKIIAYLKEAVYQKCQTSDWVGSGDLSPNLPEDLMDTPLKSV